MDKKPEEKIDKTRRGMIFSALAAAFAPETTIKTLADSSVTADSAVAITASHAALTKWLNAVDLRRAMTETAIAGKMVIADMLQYNPEMATTSIELSHYALDADSIVDSLFDKPFKIDISSGTGFLSKAGKNLLQEAPDRKTIEAAIRELSNDKNYPIIFGNRSVEEATDYLSKAIKDGQEGLNMLLNDYQENHKRIAKEKVAKTINEMQAEFRETTMASAHMMGGYPIPADYPEKEIVKIGNRGRSGEWSTRIEPPEEGKPFPLSR